MKALVYYGPGKRAWEDVRDPVVNDPEDVAIEVDTHSTPMLLAMLEAGRSDIGRMVNHRFGFDEVPEPYDLFDDPVASGALKVAVLRG